MSNKILVRVDCSPEIGLGHLVRCMALSNMLRDDFQITFYCKALTNFMFNELVNNDFSCIKIQKEEDFFNQITENTIVVLDGYHFSTSYQKQIKLLGAKLVCVDDLHDKEFVADLIINHVPGIKPNNYKAQQYTKFALGLEYVLLRPTFLKQAKQSRNIEKMETLLICFGGSDYKKLTRNTLEVALEFKEFKKIIVITGSAYANPDELDQLKKGDKRIDIRHALDENQLLAAMLESELAIVPASGILFEAYASGCKLISGTYADNQKNVYSSFNLMKLIIGASNFNSINIREAIKTALRLSLETKIEIDGNSSKRLKTIFYELICHLREANINDCQVLFDWANNSEVRKNSISKDLIEWENHVKWFSRTITSDKSRIYILVMDEIPIGQIRYDYMGNEWILDYSISSEMRGKGLGKIMLKMSLPNFKDQNIKAIVHENNISSQSVFKTLGFIQTGTFEIKSEHYAEFKLTV